MALYIVSFSSLCTRLKCLLRLLPPSLPTQSSGCLCSFFQLFLPNHSPPSTVPAFLVKDSTPIPNQPSIQSEHQGTQQKNTQLAAHGSTTAPISKRTGRKSTRGPLPTSFVCQNRTFPGFPVASFVLFPVP